MRVKWVKIDLRTQWSAIATKKALWWNGSGNQWILIATDCRPTPTSQPTAPRARSPPNHRPL